MLIIRVEQMRALEEAHLRRWIFEYLHSSYPSKVTAWSASEFHNFAICAIEGARRLGLKAPSDIRKFAHVSFLLGLEFEADDRMVWAQRILADEEQPDVSERICALEETILEQMEL